MTVNESIAGNIKIDRFYGIFEKSLNFFPAQYPL